MTIEQTRDNPPNNETNPTQRAITLMKGITPQYEALIDAASVALDNRDITEYAANNIRAAKLIIDLPGQLEACLEGTDGKTKDLILRKTREFAARTRRLVNLKDTSAISIALHSQGDKYTDKNHLEKLIDEVEGQI